MLDLEAWRHPGQISIPDDELGFVLIPPEVESAAVFELCCRVNAYQQAQLGNENIIQTALMLTMGGMAPGVLAYDHLVKGRGNLPRIDFGTLGVSFYRDLGVRLAEPIVNMPVSIDIGGKSVLAIDDLGDSGGTLRFVCDYLYEKGANQVLTLVLYMKPEAQQTCPVDFYFGEVAQNTWIITARERVEVLVQRVPVWKARGASEEECRRRLLDLIGYPVYLVDHYLPRVYSR
jgi:hypoxanthine phosphoribosyltransferase